MKEVAEKDFEKAISGPKPVVVDFSAEWCGPCKQLAPVLEQVHADRADRFDLVKVDIDKSQSLAARFGIRGVPTLIAFRNGKPLAQKVGAMSKSQLNAWIDSAIG